MSHQFTTEIGRLRIQESLARADRYRRAGTRRDKPTSGGTVSAYRKAFATAAGTLIFLLLTAGAASAAPMGPGSGSTSSGAAIDGPAAGEVGADAAVSALPLFGVVLLAVGVTIIVLLKKARTPATA